MDSLISSLLSKTKDLTRGQILELIREKRAKIGGGYLTDQGALFLVASDLGIVLDYKQDSQITLSQLDNNQVDIAVTSRVLSIGPLKTFIRKTDSKFGVLNRLVIYDNTSVAPLSLWDSNATFVINGANISPGDLIRISGAYTRPAIDGSPTLNAGEKTKIEKLPEDFANPQVEKIDNKILRPESVPENGRMLTVRGKVAGEVRKNSFIRKDGTTSELCTFSIADEYANSLIRVVIWNNQNPVFSNLKDGEEVTLLSVRSKLSSFQNQQSLELHGDDGTCVLEHWDETSKWMKEQLAKSIPDSLGEQEAKTKGLLPFVARVIAIRRSESVDGRSHVLLMDAQKRKIYLTISGDSLKDISDLGVDDIIVCRPESMDHASLKATTSKLGSITKTVAKRSDIPNSQLLFTSIEDLEKGSIASLQLMCLTDALSREIQTKDGLVKRSEITAGDPTGETKVYAWRNLSKIIDGLSAGERFVLSAVEVQSHEGKIFLVLKNYSGVEKLPV